MSDIYREILNQWEAVQKDRATAKDLLEHTGPGESPWPKALEVAWASREEGLKQTIISALPEVINAIDVKTKGCQCICHTYPNHMTLQDALDGLKHCSTILAEKNETANTFMRQIKNLQAEQEAIRQAIISAESPTGESDDLIDLVQVFIEHHKAKEAEVEKLRAELNRPKTSIR